MKLFVDRSLSLTGFALGDFNNDEDVDIVVADQKEDKLITLINYECNNLNKSKIKLSLHCHGFVLSWVDES